MIKKVPGPHDDGSWGNRLDPVSSYRAGFEVRTYRLCLQNSASTANRHAEILAPAEIPAAILSALVVDSHLPAPLRST
jgi:hypothetical protein